jgi:hypothetical protein
MRREGGHWEDDVRKASRELLSKLMQDEESADANDRAVAGPLGEEGAATEGAEGEREGESGAR